MIAIIDYKAGNITSVKNAVQRLGYEAIITADHTVIMNAEKVIFPGVGEASSAMKQLRANGLSELIVSLRQPVLGICLGQQLMCSHSEEGGTQCLGIFNSSVKKFPPKGIVPHTGWNSIYGLKTELFSEIEEHSDVYFVHSYFCELDDYTIATCNYILEFSAAMLKDNFYATQFHPEKSGSIGESILHNFLNSRK